MSNTNTLTGDAVLTKAKDSKSDIGEAEANGTTGQPYPEYAHFIKSSKRFGLRGYIPYQPPKGKSHLCTDESFSSCFVQKTILSTTRESILKMLHVKKWVPTLGYFGRTSMNARYMTRTWLKNREMVLMFCSFSYVVHLLRIIVFTALPGGSVLSRGYYFRRPNVAESTGRLHGDIC